MSNLFCFGCNYPGEEHDERCPEYVDVPRLIEQRDRFRTDNDHLRAALRRYGQHDYGVGCVRGSYPTEPCACGLDAALGEE